MIKIKAVLIKNDNVADYFIMKAIWKLLKNSHENFEKKIIEKARENMCGLWTNSINNAKPRKGIYLLNGLYYVNVLQNLVNVPQAHSNQEGL